MELLGIHGPTVIWSSNLDEISYNNIISKLVILLLHFSESNLDASDSFDFQQRQDFQIYMQDSQRKLLKATLYPVYNQEEII